MLSLLLLTLEELVALEEKRFEEVMARKFLHRALKPRADLLWPAAHPALQGELLYMRFRDGLHAEGEPQYLDRDDRRARKWALCRLGHHVDLVDVRGHQGHRSVQRMDLLAKARPLRT